MNSKEIPVYGKILIGLHVFLGIGAMFGGVSLMISPTGELLNMPSSMLNDFFGGSFLIPGIILFVVLGVIPLLIAYGLIRPNTMRIAEKLNIFKEDTSWPWAYSLYMGFAVLIWINVQLYIVQAVALIHVVYLILGFAIQIMTLLPSVRKHYQSAS